MTDYKDPFTLDGRLKPMPSVTPAKVAEMKKMVEGTMAGDYIQRGRLMEAMTSTDALFSYAYLTQLNFLPQFERAPRTWQTIAGQRTLSDFRAPVLYSIVTDWSGPGVLGAEGNGSNGVIPVVPEAAPYPFAYMQGEESKASGIQKRGFKTDFTFEAFINDAVGFIQALPGEMLRIALDTEEYEVYGALINGVTNAQQIAGGTVPDGEVVVANSPLTRNALIRAQFELAQRKINGRYVAVNGGYNLIVAVGQRAWAEYALTSSLLQVRNGTNPQYIVQPGNNPLGSVDIIESPYVSGTAWYMLPKPGTTARPVLEHASLVGHETPELRVENATGQYIGGGSVSPFEGSFANDSATLRIRMFGNGILWSKELVVWSTGAGA